VVVAELFGQLLARALMSAVARSSETPFLRRAYTGMK
jgi:hypothetical protein